MLRFVPRVQAKLETGEDGNEFVLDDVLKKMLPSLDGGQMLDAPEPFVDCDNLSVSLLRIRSKSDPRNQLGELFTFG